MRGTRRSWTVIGATLGAGAVVGSVLVFAGAGAAARQAAPKNTSPPTISGTPQEGKTLQGHKGEWDNSPTDFNFIWQRCSKDGGSCSTIDGATSQKYTLKSVDVGNTLRLRVDAKNSDGTTSATSVPTAVIQKATPAPPSKGTCSSSSGTVGVSDIDLPIRLLIDKWSFSPSLVTAGTQTVVARIHVADTCGHSVSGANVWATAIPYNQVSVEQSTTDASGYATLTFRVESGFPANPGRQQIMAVLVRASDPADKNPLAGKSTRRALNLSVRS
jgi:hypothetical protein